MTDPQHPYHFLNDVLVLSVRKSFWASPECEVFPNRLYSKTIMRGPGRFGSSRNPINNLSVALEGYLYFLRHRPKLIFFGSATRIVPWFARLKKRGFLPGVKLLATNQSYLSDDEVQSLDKVIVYSRSEIALHDAALRDKYEFMPLPADGNFDLIKPSSSSTGNYIFAGGGASRDFTSLIEAVRGLDVQLKIVTFSPKSLGYNKPLPDNCEVHWKMPLPQFLDLMAGASFVVVPLQEGRHPHGHTTVVQALRMGKAVITTRNASTNDYVSEGQEGLLVSPGNVSEYRQAIVRLLENPELLDSCERYALQRASDLTYHAFAQRTISLCQRMLAS